MVRQKVSSSKKSQSQKVAKTTKKQDNNINNAELEVIQKSFEMVKKLKNEVQNIKASKEEISKNVKKIEEKVAKHESSAKKQNIHHEILHSLKEEISKDLAPVLKKFNLKTAKEEIFKEISKLIELESAKLKSEIDSINVKNKKDFTKKLSDLEVKVLQSLNENERIRVKLKNNSTQINFSKEIEDRMHDIVARANEKYFTMLDANTLDLSELQKQSKTLDAKLTRLKNIFKKHMSEEDLNLSSIESKMLKLEEDNVSIKALLERYENDLYSKNKKQTTELETKITKLLDNANLKLKDLEKKNKSQEKFIVDKINEIIDYVQVVEKQIKSAENQDISKTKKELLKTITKESKELEQYTKNFLAQAQKELWTDYKQFMALKDEVLPQYEEFKKKFEAFEESKEKVTQELKENIAQELITIKDISKQNNEITKTATIELDKNIKDFEQKFQIQTQKQVEDFKTKLRNEINASIVDALTELNQNKNATITDINSHKKEIFTKINQKFKEISDEYSQKVQYLTTHFNGIEVETQKIEDKFNTEKDAQQKFLVEKFNAIIDEINSKNKEDIKYIKEEAKKDLKALVEKTIENKIGSLKKDKEQLDQKLLSLQNNKVELDKLLEESKSEIASQIAQNHEYLTKINLENKEDKAKLQEDIETKFLNSKKQYDEIFTSHMKLFDKELRVREKEFIEKLNFIEHDKKEMIKELVSFKTEISVLTKNYIKKLDEEFQKIKVLEANFENEKDAFTTQIGEVYEQRKQGLQVHSEELENKLTQQILAQKEAFDENENTFRELFKEKIQNLHETLNKRIDSLQKRFVEKNLKYVTDKLESEMEIFKLYEERLISKEEELTKKQDILNDQYESLGADLEAKEEDLNAKVEERLISLEQHFNKRFLEYDGSFSNFKGVVIDELEDFMKEINTLTSTQIEQIEKETKKRMRAFDKYAKERFEEFEKLLTKLKFTNAEMEKSLAHFNSVEQSYEVEITTLREEVADTAAKLHLFDEVSSYGLHDHVQYMSEYESQLVGLIKNLKSKGISNDNIKAALINKGHPRFYVAMIVKDFDTLYN